jgi:L-lactate utilization protein LutB
MGNKERLKGILERQAAAAERERLDEEAASAKAEKVRSVRVEVIQKWQEQRAHLETYIDQINKETSKNGVQLFVVKNPRHADTGPDRSRSMTAGLLSACGGADCGSQ